jgi:DNA polymerase-3 subunit epsilon
MKLIFDVETNGLNSSCSILSFSALVIDENNEVINEFDRYYYRREGEEIDPVAVGINGLTDETIKFNRADATYPKYFGDDSEIFDLFTISYTLYIAHNIQFDKGFMEYHHEFFIPEEKEFCTMLATQYVYDAPYMRYGEPKYPKLSESVAYYNIDTSKFLDKGGYHSSLFDCYCCLEVFKSLEKDND